MTTKGTSYSLLKEAAKKPITAVIAMEILLHTYIHQVGLAPHHVKRDYNQWADELTHPTFRGFSTALRLDERGPHGGVSALSQFLVANTWSSPMPSAERRVKLANMP